MDNNEYIRWVNATMEHINAVDRIVEDRKLLKGIIETHLQEFFTWDAIEYNRDFSVITLTLPDTHIRTEKISELLMDWSVRPSFNDGGYEVIKIEVYPLGVPNDEGEL